MVGEYTERWGEHVTDGNRQTERHPRSGSDPTGFPKGIVHLHHGIPITCETYARDILRLTEADTIFARALFQTEPAGKWRMIHRRTPGNRVTFGDERLRAGGGGARDALVVAPTWRLSTREPRDALCAELPPEHRRAGRWKRTREAL